MDNVVSGPRREPPRLVRASIAEQVAKILRERIMEGFYKPGKQLSEELIAKELEVSRNTLREAFRLLGHDRLLEHRPNRGVFVRTLTVEDVTDVYRMRRVLEGAAILRKVSKEGLAKIRKAVADAERAAAKDDWQAVGTANIRFHQALVAANGSARIDTAMEQLLAELRLVFHAMTNPRILHEPFVERNRFLLGLMEAGHTEEAATYLDGYLDDAEQVLREATGPR